VSVGVTTQKVAIQTVRGNVADQIRKMTQKKLSEILATKKRKRGTRQELADKRNLRGTKKSRRVLTKVRDRKLRETSGQENIHRRIV